MPSYMILNFFNFDYNPKISILYLLSATALTKTVFPPRCPKPPIQQPPASHCSTPPLRPLEVKADVLHLQVHVAPSSPSILFLVFTFILGNFIHDMNLTFTSN